MADYITPEIQEEIIERLPVRSLIRCRSVSKAWKALIDSPKFIATYSVRHTYSRHLLISYLDMEDDRYVSIADDDTFPQQRYAPTVPLSIKQLPSPQIVGSSSGLLCFYGYWPKFSKAIVVLWNITIRKSIAIDVPNMKYGIYETVFGFGVCPMTNDPKIVKIIHLNRTKSNNIIPWNVEVYTLSSREWRTPSCGLPRPSIEVLWEQVVIDRMIYWLAFDWVAINGGFQISRTIISFDITNEEFREVYLPDSLTHLSAPGNISEVEVGISKLRESFVVLEYNNDANKRICVVWMMEHRVPNSFTKLFTINTPFASIHTLGFRKGDQPIMEVRNYAKAGLIVYEPYSKCINYALGIFGSSGTFSVNSYMETLLLLN